MKLVKGVLYNDTPGDNPVSTHHNSLMTNVSLEHFFFKTWASKQRKRMLAEPTDVHIDSAMSNISILYRNFQYIWQDVLPILKVAKRSDKYFLYDKDQRFRLPSDAVGPLAYPNEVDQKYSNTNYSVVDHALGGWVAKEEEENADTPLSPLIDETELIAELLNLAQEYRVAAKVFATATYATANKTTLTGGTTQWNNAGTSYPIQDIQTALETPFMRPNVLIFGLDAWVQLRKHAQILDAVKSSTRFQAAAGGLATESEVASLFDVEKVLVGRARYETAAEGQTQAYSRIWGKSMAALYVRPAPTIKGISFGYTFCEQLMETQSGWEGRRGAKGATWLKTGWNSTEIVVAADVGYLIDQAVA